MPKSSRPGKFALRDRSNECQLTVTASAKAQLKQAAGLHGAKQKELVSRVIVWFAAQPADEQARILREGHRLEGPDDRTWSKNLVDRAEERAAGAHPGVTGVDSDSGGKKRAKGA